VTDLNRVPHPSRDHVVRTAGEETVFLAPAGDHIHSLNATGTVIWNLIDGERSLQAILDAVVAGFEVPPDQARADLLAFVDELAAKGLVVWEVPTAGE